LGWIADEELPDYVMILIANRRTVPQMETDLSLFLGDSSKKFVSWLTHVLKKLDQVTSSTSVQKGGGGSEEGTIGGDGGVGGASSSKLKSSKKGGTSSKVKSKKGKDKSKERSKSKDKHKKKKETVVPASSGGATTEERVTNTVHSTTAAVIGTSSSKKAVAADSSSSVGVGIKKDKEDIVDSLAEAGISSRTTEDGKSKEVVEKSSSTKVKLTMKNSVPLKKSKITSSTFLEDDLPKARLTLLSDNEEDSTKRKTPIRTNHPKGKGDALTATVVEQVVIKEGTETIKNVDENSKMIEKENGSVLVSSIKKPNKSVQPEEQVDTLILNTEENEFADNVDELRRIALESQEKKRKEALSREEKSKTTPQKRLITGILLSNKEAFNGKPVAKVYSSRSERLSRRSPVKTRESPPPRSSTKETPVRILRSPKRSVFDRLSGDMRRSGKSRRSQSRSRSRSPVRKLTSTIGSVINRSTSVDDVDEVRPTVSSVIKVTDRPKRDLKMNNKLLLLAVQDAQKSIIQNEQKPKPPKVNENKPKHKHESRKVVGRRTTRSPSSSSKKDVLSEKRFREYSDVNADDSMDVNPNSRKKTIKERLGVKRERRSIKDRLGAIPTQEVQHTGRLYAEIGNSS
jgi:hypothetical protein